MNRNLRLALLLVLPGCASAPPAQPPAPPVHTLAYSQPVPATAAYAFSDSSAFNVQGGGMGVITVAIASRGAANVTFAPQGGDLKATIQITKFNGSMTNSQMGAAPSATEADVQGAAVLTVTPRGVATLDSLPKLTENAERVGLSAGFFRRFFVRLPGSNVKAGAVWTDTVATTDDMGGTKASVQDVVTATLLGDTVVNGRTLAHISSTTQRTLNVSGSSQGVEIAQKLTGTARATWLWDRERNLLVDRTEDTDLTGTFDLPGMGVTGLPVTAHSHSRMTLQ